MTNTQSANEFVKAEADEHGYDYVESQFASGYEPMLVNGVCCWCEKNDYGTWQPIGSKSLSRV